MQQSPVFSSKEKYSLLTSYDHKNNTPPCLLLELPKDKDSSTWNNRNAFKRNIFLPLFLLTYFFTIFQGSLLKLSYVLTSHGSLAQIRKHFLASFFSLQLSLDIYFMVHALTGTVCPCNTCGVPSSLNLPNLGPTMAAPTRATVPPSA